MPKKFRNRNEPEYDEITIKYSQYVETLAQVLVEQKVLKKDKIKLFKTISSDFINEHLFCIHCNNIMPDENFYKQKAQFANRFRAQVCKDCWKYKYIWKKQNKT